MNDVVTMRATQQGRYALVMPVRDEERFIADMIESILAQDVLPAKWVIVDDGSSDNTGRIIDDYARSTGLIDAVHLPIRGERKPGGEDAIKQALNALAISHYDFLARFDGDLIFGKGYIKQILAEFGRDPRLGIAGGGLYIEKDGVLTLELVPDYHVRGALKMYRRECFEDIGGLFTGIGWDTIDEVYAWTRGWKTRSFFNYDVVHRRPTGEGIAARHLHQQRGKAEYYTWSHPGFVFAKALRLALTQGHISNAACYVKGFVECYVQHESRLRDRVFARARRSQQLQRMLNCLKPGKLSHDYTGPLAVNSRNPTAS